MTASRYKAPKGFLAGNRFGLNLFDLFKEDEEGDGYSLSGFEGLAPSFTTQNLEKGRGGVVGYKTNPNAPKFSRVSTFSLTPEQGASSAPSASTAPPAETTPKTEEIDLGPLAAQYGATGLFGHMDYIKAKEQGYTDEQIGDWMRVNPSLVAESNRPGQTGGLYEQMARGQVNTAQAQTRDWADAMKTFQAPGGELGATQVCKEARAYEGAPQISATFGQSEKYFGDEDLKAARMSGYSDQAIKDFLEKNISLLRGGNVPGGENELGQLTAEFKQPEPQPSSGGGGGGGSSAPSIGTGAGASAEYFGHADVEAAKSGGASNEQIAEFIKQNQNLLQGGNVAGGGGLYDQYKQYMR